MIERIFSELYKYLQFKSTTNETFPSHINIDSGYKYLKTESIMRSENSKTVAYFDDRGGTPSYLAYLGGIRKYLSDTSSILTSDEKTVLEAVLDEILAKTDPDWVG